jgi:FkbM family methyltransferase
MGQRRIRNAISAAIDKLGYQVRRKQPPGWGDDAYRDQQRLLEGSPVRVVMDVGANVGDTVHQYRALFPAATIHAFEPFPDVHRQLAERFATDPQVHTHQRAVTDAVGTRRLYVNDVHVTNSLLPLNPASAAWAGASDQGLDRTVDVPAMTLDQFCTAEGLTRIDLLKIDIQGGEAMALEGATGLLERGAVRLIYLEVLFAPLYNGQAFFCDVMGILHRHGYHLFGLYNLMHRDRGLGWGDAIFRSAHASRPSDTP